MQSRTGGTRTNAATRFAIGNNTDAESLWIDAFYSGIDYYAAWTSLHPSMISTPQFIDSAGVRHLLADGSNRIRGDILPDGNKTRDFGSATMAFDDIYADDFQNVASETKSRYIEPSVALESIKAIRKCKDSEQPDYATMVFAEPFMKEIKDKDEKVIAVEIHHKRSLVKNLDYLNSANQALEQRIATLEGLVLEMSQDLKTIKEAMIDAQK